MQRTVKMNLRPFLAVLADTEIDFLKRYDLLLLFLADAGEFIYPQPFLNQRDWGQRPQIIKTSCCLKSWRVLYPTGILMRTSLSQGGQKDL
jgi:hypothetical protein